MNEDDTADMITQFSEDLSVILETFIEETQDAKIIISRMETEIGRLKEDIGLLNRTIRDGNGQKPMITRITILEERIREVKEGIEGIEGEQEAEKKMRWEFLLASIPGILALLATLLP